MSALMPTMKRILAFLKTNPVEPQGEVAFRYGINRTHKTLDMAGTAAEPPEGLPQEAQVLYAGFMAGISFVASMFKPEANPEEMGRKLADQPVIFISNMGDIAATAINERYTGTRPAQTITVESALVDIMESMGIPPEMHETMLKEMGLSVPKPTETQKTQAAPGENFSASDLERLFNLPDDPTVH